MSRIGAKLRAALPPSLTFWLKFKRAKLLAGWRNAPQRNYFKPDTSAQSGTANNGGQRHAIVFDDHLPAPDRDAGGVRMSLILKSLAKLGQPVFISLSKLR